jgi:branched-chain amino acid transport system permease protein
MDILPQILVNGLIAGSMYALIALGFNVIYGTVKFFDLSYGAIILVGSYAVYTSVKLAGLPLLVAAPIAIAIGGFLPVLLYRTVYVQLAKRKASNIIYLVASLGVFTMMQSVFAMVFTSQFQTVASGVSNVIRLGTVVITLVQAITIVCACLVTAGVILFLKHSRVGTLLRAISDEPEIATGLGIRVPQITSWAFGIGGSIAALAGILTAYDIGIDPHMGFGLLLKGVIAAIIGGVGVIHGGIIGGLFLGIIENLGVWQFSAEWKDLIAFCILILFLFVKPTGFCKK